jgi:hypothetical protein
MARHQLEFVPESISYIQMMRIQDNVYYVKYKIIRQEKCTKNSTGNVCLHNAGQIIHLPR